MGNQIVSITYEYVVYDHRIINKTSKKKRSLG